MKSLVVAAAAAVAIAAGDGGADAGGTHGALAADPVSAWVTDGEIHAVATPGGVYVGGEFGLIGRNTGSWVEIAATGASGAPWPAVDDDVAAAARDGRGGWYVAGSFTRVGGVRVSGLAHIRANRTVDARWRPAVNGEVHDIEVKGSTVFIAGDFTRVSGRGDLRSPRSTRGRDDRSAASPTEGIRRGHRGRPARADALPRRESLEDWEDTRGALFAFNTRSRRIVWTLAAPGGLRRSRSTAERCTSRAASPESDVRLAPVSRRSICGGGVPPAGVPSSTGKSPLWSQQPARASSTSAASSRPSAEAPPRSRRRQRRTGSVTAGIQTSAGPLRRSSRPVRPSTSRESSPPSEMSSARTLARSIR